MHQRWSDSRSFPPDSEQMVAFQLAKAHVRCGKQSCRKGSCSCLVTSNEGPHDKEAILASTLKARRHFSLLSLQMRRCRPLRCKTSCMLPNSAPSASSDYYDTCATGSSHAYMAHASCPLHSQLLCAMMQVLDGSLQFSDCAISAVYKAQLAARSLFTCHRWLSC